MKYIHDHYGKFGDHTVSGGSLFSWFDNDSNVADGGWFGNASSATEVGAEKLGAIAVLSQGGKAAQSAAVTSEALGMGGSASVGIFRAGTLARGLAAGAEEYSPVIGIPLAYWATWANKQASDACDCQK